MQPQESSPHVILETEDHLDDHLGLPLGDRLKSITDIINKSVAIKDSLC